VLDFVLRPARAAFRALNEDALKPIEQTERETLDAVKAIDSATLSIEHHVEVIETLATSVGPLTDSVNRLTETMRDLVEILAPLASAEHGIHRAEHEVEHAEHDVERAEHFLGFRRHKKPPQPGTGQQES
jgi:hypothetical protein